MKKIISLVLALAMLALTLCPAMAETAEIQENTATQTLTAPKGGYSIEVPSNYVSLNTETFMTFFTSEKMQQQLVENMGLQSTAQLEQYMAVMEQSNMMLVYTSDMTGMFNVQTGALPMTMEQLVAMKSVMDRTTAQQYIALGIAEEDIHTMDIQEIGGRSWYAMKVTMMGFDVLVLLTVENGMQYAFTFTGIDLETSRSILNTFTVIE